MSSIRVDRCACVQDQKLQVYITAHVAMGAVPNRKARAMHCLLKHSLPPWSFHAACESLEPLSHRTEREGVLAPHAAAGALVYAGQGPAASDYGVGAPFKPSLHDGVERCGKGLWVLQIM